MRRLYSFIFSLLIIGLSYGQVGINTVTPRAGSVLHIDPKGDTNAVGTSNITDDVFFTNAGRLGIGAYPSTTRLQIDKGSASSFIRIEDTSEGTGDKYLASDANGNGSWVPAVGLYGKAYRMNSVTNVTTIYNTGVESAVRFNLIKPDGLPLANNPNANGYMDIGADGNYLFTIRWWGSAGVLPVSTAGTPYYPIQANLRLYKVVGGILQPGVIGQFSLYMVNRRRDEVAPAGNYGRLGFITSIFVAGLRKNDQIALVVQPITYPWLVGEGVGGISDNPTFFPSIVIYNV